MGAFHQTRSEGSFAPIDTARASIAMRLVMMCDEFIKVDEPQKALAAYHQARNILDGLADSQKHNIDLGLTLSLLHIKIGDLMRGRGDLWQANEAYQSSLAIADRLATLHSADENHRRNDGEALTALSTVINTIGFEPMRDSSVRNRKGFISLREALASARVSCVEAPATTAEVEASAAKRRVVEKPNELSFEASAPRAPSDLPGQFIHNIPRRMRVGVLETVEVRIPRRQGDEAMTVRLWSPDGSFLIDPLSPETCWTEEAKGDGNGYTSWQWKVNPQHRGHARLLLIMSAQTRDTNGVTAQAAFPDQVIKVYVQVSHGRAVRKLASWALLLVAGSAASAWGRDLYPVALDVLDRFWFSLGNWVL
jgi:hypothetical protein